MKKILIVLICSIGLLSCSDNDLNLIREGNVVKCVNLADNTMPIGTCKFVTENNEGYHNSFFAQCGTYAVGDTIHFQRHIDLTQVQNEKPFIVVNLPLEWPSMSEDSTKPDTILTYRIQEVIYQRFK